MTKDPSSPFRDDREALLHRADHADREAKRLDQENAAMRQALVMQTPPSAQLLMLPAGAIYKLDPRSLPLQDRSHLAYHTVTKFPVWAVGLLNVLTFGLFPLIHLGLIHDRLPPASRNDPSAGKAIGFSFIPYFNWYWLFFNPLRLCDRLDFQLRLRGKKAQAPKGMVITAGIFTVIPYLNLLGIPIFWTIAACRLRRTANMVAELDATEWDASEVAGHPSLAASSSAAPGSAITYRMAPEEEARELKARRLVRWSHGLGWGGLGTLLAGSAVAGAVAGPVAAVAVAAASGVSVVAGAIVGQIGRGMQGRAI